MTSGGPGKTREPEGTRRSLLNPLQRQAVEYCDGPLQVIAGPGTGKTRVITEKVLHLIQAGGFSPEHILALTFTEKAAGEMAGRIRASLAAAGVKGQPHVSTFHSFCYDLVQEYADRLGYDGPLRLLQGPLFAQFVAENVDKFSTDNTDLVGKVGVFSKTLADFTSRCHDEGLIDKDISALVEEWLARGVPAKDQRSALRVRDLAASVPTLLKIQREQNIVTYGDLLTLAVRLLAENDDVRAEVQQKFRYLLVDEFQDNNITQFHLVNLLAEKHKLVLVVGDEDQSIYRFRGARMDLMDEFRRHWEAQKDAPALKVVSLEENYRSTASIIDVGQAVIKNNRERFKGKTLRRADASTATGPEHAQLSILETDTQEDAFIAYQVLRCVREEKRAPGEIAILCRSLNHVQSLVALLRRVGVPVEVVGGGGLFLNAVVREMLAWLKAIDNPAQDEVALHRVLRLQSFGLSHADQRALGRAAQDARIPLISLLEEVDAYPGTVRSVSRQGIARIAGFLSVYRRFQEDARPQGRPDVMGLIYEILDFTGLARRLRPDSVQGRQDLAAIGGLLQAAENYQEHYPYPSLHGFVRFLDLLEELGHDDTVGEPSEDKETVKVMTVHQSKGREFPVVVVGSLSDRFPPENRREWPRKFLDHLTLKMPVEDAHLEEERRVLFVALTRAQQELLLSAYLARNGKLIADPSPFLAEVQSAPTVQTVAIAPADIPPLETTRGTLTTRHAIEARLHYLTSRLGSHTEGEDVKATLTEAMRLFAGLAAEGAAGGPGTVQEALKGLGLPEDLDLRYLEPDPPAGVSGPLYLSASSLNLYSECPRQFYYKQVVRIPEASSFEARLGTAIHAALEAFHRKHPRADPALLPELIALFETEVGDVKFQSEKEKEQGLARGREILSQYLTEEAARDGNVIAVEQEFTLTLGADVLRNVAVDRSEERSPPDVILSGKIDRLDELADKRVRVIDYKTGRLKSRPEYLKDFQMPIYAWAVTEVLARELESVEVIGLKELKNGPQLQRQVLPWADGSKYALTPARLTEVKEEVAAVVQGIRDGKFDPVPEERRCGYCAYRLLCEKAWGANDAEPAGSAKSRVRRRERAPDDGPVISLTPKPPAEAAAPAPDTVPPSGPGA